MLDSYHVVVFVSAKSYCVVRLQIVSALFMSASSLMLLVNGFAQ